MNRDPISAYELVALQYQQFNNSQFALFNPRTDGGGGFVDNGKTAARSAAKFGMTISSSLLHIMCKL